MFKVEVIADSSGKWVGNGLTFDTKAQAEAYARDLASRWMAVREWRVLAYCEGCGQLCLNGLTPEGRCLYGCGSSEPHKVSAETLPEGADYRAAQGGELRPRELRHIALEIRREWKKVYFGAVPYLEAMATLSKVTDNFDQDSGESIVRYFLGNATTWKGETARRIKAELKALLKKGGR